MRLGDIAKVRFGIKTGANEFFYLEPTGKSTLKGLMHVRNGAGWEGFIEEQLLRPVIKSQREIKSILIRPQDLKYNVFMCHLSKAELARQEKDHATEYIRWGEHKGYHKRPTCVSREKWWDLGERIPGKILWSIVHGDRLIAPFNLADFYIDHNLWELYPKDIPQVFGALLNWTSTAIFKELFGRANLGEGGLKTEGIDIVQFPILSPDSLTASQLQNLEKSFNEMSEREIKNIFEEFGLPKSNKDYSNISTRDISLDKVSPDRRELDKIVFEAIGLTEEEQLEVYRAVVELVKNRLVKAGSV